MTCGRHPNAGWDKELGGCMACWWSDAAGLDRQTVNFRTHSRGAAVRAIQGKQLRKIYEVAPILRKEIKIDGDLRECQFLFCHKMFKPTCTQRRYCSHVHMRAENTRREEVIRKELRRQDAIGSGGRRA